MPTSWLAASLRSSRPAAPVSFGYNGGPVMQAGTRTVPVFWEPSTLQSGASATVDSNYNSLIERYLNDLGGSALYNNLTQYYGTSTKYIVNSSGVLQAIVDTNPYPAAAAACTSNSVVDCMSDAQIQSELSSVIGAHSIPTNYRTLYAVFLAPNEAECFDAKDCFNPINTNNWVFCAYHSAFDLASDPSKPVIYALMPYIDVGASSLSGCDTSGTPPQPNSDLAFDAETPALGHEVNEAITDPDANGSGWYDNTNGEIGDICDTNTVATQTWQGHTYVNQSEWSNVIAACKYGGNENVSLTSTSGVAGSTTTVSGTGFPASTSLDLWFDDSSGSAFGGSASYQGASPVTTTTTTGAGTFSTSFTIPSGAAKGSGIVDVTTSQPESGASAAFQVVAPTFKPDGEIGGSQAGPFTGAGVYNTTGAGQTFTRKVAPKKSGIFWVKVQNNGNTQDSIFLKGAKAPAGFTASYMSGTTVITSQVLAGTFHQGVSAGGSLMIEVIVGVKGSATSGSTFKDKIVAKSAGDTSKTDAVVALTKVK
jgi:hypothetical protein